MGRTSLKQITLAVCAAALLVPASATAATLTVQGTTDVRDAGLVDDVLVPGFHAAYPQYDLSYVAVGTGQALTNARAGAGSAVLTHAPSLEAQFVRDGFSAEPIGRAIFYSDYVIIGPNADPAGVFANAPHDAAAAFERIATAGAAGTADFVSRGDNSGTNVEEEQIWGLATGVTTRQSTTGGTTDTTRRIPGAATNPTWYHQANLGQAATVTAASQCPTATYPSGNCYGIFDRGTVNRLVANGTVTNLKVVADRNTPGTRGGQNLLLNPFHVYAVNPAKFPAGTIDAAGAQAFLDYLTSPGFQERLSSYPTSANPAFFADAYPSFSALSTLPTAIRAGTSVTVGGALTNNVPGAAQLTGGAVGVSGAGALAPTVFTPLGNGVVTGGAFSLKATPNRSGPIRVDVARFRDLSPVSRTIGTVAITASVKTTKRTPGFASVKVTGTALPGAERKAATVRLLGKKSGQKSYKTVATKKLATTGAAYSVTASVRPGTYSMKVRYTDTGVVTSGDSSSFRVKVKAITLRTPTWSALGSGRVRFSTRLAPKAARGDKIAVQGRTSSKGSYRTLATVSARRGRSAQTSTVKLPVRSWQLRLQYRHSGTTYRAVSRSRSLSVR